ncbi:MAG: hypothetical protein Q9226_005142 [Calogaya cf. arnoldii]
MPGPEEPIPQLARQFLKEPHILRHLDLDFDHMAQDDSVSEKANGRYTSSGALQALFTGFNLPTIKLRILNLSCVNLRRAHHDLLPALDIPFLEKLSICSCQHAEDLLNALCQASQRSTMSLKTFDLYHAQHYIENVSTAIPKTLDPLLAATNAFLASISPLRNLFICLRGFDQLPDVASVGWHGPSLRLLFIDVRKAKGPLAITYSAQEWATLCMCLRNIYQFDMTFPVARADCDISLHEEFEHYIVSSRGILYSLEAQWVHH